MRNIVPLHRRVLTCACAVFAVSIMLTGCANPVDKALENMSSSAADSLVSDVTGTEIEGIGSSELPADFPKDVPLPESAPASAISNTTDGERSWIVHFENGVDDDAYDELKVALEAHDFALETSSDMEGAIRLAVYTNDDYTVNVSLLGSPEDGQMLQMMVSENSPH